MRYIASIDTEPPTSGDFTDADEAIAWARENAGGRTWVVSELPDEVGAGPPRTVASALGDDVERPADNEHLAERERRLRAEDDELEDAS
jgi:hypothetical protein